MIHNATQKIALADLRGDIIGLHTPVPLLDGSRRRYVFLDNGASTPAFGAVLRAVERFLPWYSGVHRGVGTKALVATQVYENAHHTAGGFVGADPATHEVVFVKNTTEAVNKLSHIFRFSPDDVVLSTMMEHHSNDLPWRRRCRVVRAGLLPDGSIDLAALRSELRRLAGRVRLVAVSGASNVTGICNPIHDIAEWSHAAGARIFVDAAQLVAHRPVAMGAAGDPGCIDFLAFSAHKIYAPFGTGVLIGPREFFRGGEPDMVGGGTVSYVGTDEVEWGSPPQKEEAGSPNVVGAVALAASLSILRSVGMEAVARHEQGLLEHTLKKMKQIPGVRLYGPPDPKTDRVGVVPFTVEGMDHALVATILSVEGGIGVRNGNFCAQPYVRTLLNVSSEEEKAKRAARCDNPALPGMVRASFGCYNNEEDADILIDMVDRISRKQYSGTYTINPVTGVYEAEGYDRTAPLPIVAEPWNATPPPREELA